MKHFFKLIVVICALFLSVTLVQAGEPEKKINVYPTPVERGAILTVELQLDEQVERTVMLYSPVGKVIYTLKTTENTVEFNAPDVSGIYLLRVVEKQKVMTVEKIIVK